MTAQIIPLPLDNVLRTQITHAVRSGELAFRQVEDLHAAGRLPIKTLITDASKAKNQQEFIRSLSDTGSDITLDTKAAELGALSKFETKSKSVAWAPDNNNRMLMPHDFEVGSNKDIHGAISRLSIDLGVSRVLSPSHFWRDGLDDPWLQTDLNSASLLRRSLDREGGKNIAIDFPIIIPHTKILDRTTRLALIKMLADSEFSTLVLRMSGFGDNAAPSTVKRVYEAIADFHDLKVPIMLDHVGGLVGLGALALGVVSGIANGVGELARFDASAWHKQPKDRDSSSFGRAAYIPIPNFDKSFKRDALQYIASLDKGRRAISCNDKNCCPKGLDSTLRSPKAHLAYQNTEALARLAEVPDARRMEHFLKGEMQKAERKIRELSRVKIPDEKLSQTVHKHANRIDSLSRIFEGLSGHGWMGALPVRPSNERKTLDRTRNL